jgi:hypothetical protein
MADALAIDPSDINGVIRPVSAGGAVVQEVVIFDDVPGGAGHALRLEGGDELTKVLTRQSRKRITDAKMALVRQNGWCLRQPTWGECHGYSMAVPDEVRQSYRLHPALF